MLRDKHWKLALWGGLCLSCSQVLAQSAMPGMQGQRTLGELIDAIKAQREAVLLHALPPAPAPAPTPTPTPTPTASDLSRHRWPVDPPEQTPRLWSLTGMNGRFTAVLVLNGKVHRLESDALPMDVDGWRVSQMDPSGVFLGQKGRSLKLAAPHGWSMAHSFVLDGGLK